MISLIKVAISCLTYSNYTYLQKVDIPYQTRSSFIFRLNVEIFITVIIQALFGKGYLLNGLMLIKSSQGFYSTCPRGYPILCNYWQIYLKYMFILSLLILKLIWFDTSEYIH